MGGGPAVDPVEQARRQEEERQRAAAQRQQELLDQARKGREEDLAAGRARGQELFGQGSLGTRTQDEISGDFADIIARRKAALDGLTPEERNALESQALAGINQATQTQLRQLRGIQGAQGLRGGIASAQQAQALQQGQQAAAEAQRDIFLQNIGARRQALSDLENTIGSEQQRAQQEKFGQLSTEFGFAGLGAAERGAVAQQALGEQQATLARLQASQNQGKNIG